MCHAYLPSTFMLMIFRFIKLFCSAFARYPDGIIEHYFCAKENLPQEKQIQAQPSRDTTSRDEFDK